MLKSYYPHTLFNYDHYLFPKVSQYKILNLWLSITLILFLRFILLNGHKSNHEWKQKEKPILIMVYNASIFKGKKNDIKLRGSQVVLYINKCGHVKQKSGDLNSNWQNVFFNLTKGMTGFFLSDQFWNIKLDNELYSLKHQCLCFYVDSLIH